MQGLEKERFLKLVKTRTAVVRDKKAVEKHWQQLCERNKHEYLSYLLGHGPILRKLNSSQGIHKFLYSKKLLTSIRNVILCESHREVLQTIFDRNMVQ